MGDAPVSDQPTCPAAAPHVAASAIHPNPLSAHLPEVTTANLLLHRFSEASQKSPVADVQAPEAPQTQGAGLAVMLSPWAQAGPVNMQTQASPEVPHAAPPTFEFSQRPPLLW